MIGLPNTTSIKVFVIKNFDRIAQGPGRILIIRGLIIAFTLLVSLIFAPSAALGQRNALVIILGVLGIFAFTLLLNFPHLGLIALVSANLIVPFEIGTGSESRLNIAILMVGVMAVLLILKFVTKRTPTQIIKDHPTIPILGLILASILSLVSGQLTYFATPPAPIRAQLGGMALFVLSGLAFLEVAYQVQDIKWLKWMTWVFLITGTIEVAGYFLPSSIGLINGSTGSQFWTWMLVLSFSQAYINKRLPLKWRAALWVLVGMILYVGLFKNRDWLSGWFPGLLSIALILWIYDKRIRLPLILGGLFIFALNSHILTDLFMGGDNQYSLMTRLEAWKILGQIISANPILGLGPANYYWYTSLYQILGYTVVFNSHNNFVDIIAETGLLGLFFFLWIAWAIGRLAWKNRKIAPVGFEKAYVYGAIGGLVGTWFSGMLGDWVIPFVYNVGFTGFRASVLSWLFLGGVVAIDRLRQSKAEVDNIQSTGLPVQGNPGKP